MKRMTFAATIAAALVLASGCNAGGQGDAGGSGAFDPSAPVPATPVVSTTPSAASAPAFAAPTKSTKARKLKIGAKGADVLALQRRLVKLGYWVGKADGKFGGNTQQAVFALQKAAGLSRDGVVGPKTQKALAAGVRPKAKSGAHSGYLVEINLRKQLLMLVKNGAVVVTLNTSTGSNKHYKHDGHTYLADTPPGHFKVTRQIDGMRDGPLGKLWRPKYFNGGIAIHGSASVPPYPASHGCARLSNAAIDWIWDTKKVPLKTRVWVYPG